MDALKFARKVLKQFNSKKTRDYGYLVLFFLIFSFFIFFVIRPSINTALSLIKEESFLKKTNATYETAISIVVSIQEQMQQNQNRLLLLSEALPDKPKLSKLLTDVESAGKNNQVILKSVSVEGASLTEKSSNSLKTIELNVEVLAKFENLLSFIRSLENQKRIKSIKEVDIKKDDQATGSANLNTTIKMVGYYL